MATCRRCRPEGRPAVREARQCAGGAGRDRKSLSAGVVGPGGARGLETRDERFTLGTEAAGFRAATDASPRGIISATGRTGARPRSRTSPCSVAAITAPSTRRATRSIETQTARSNSDGPMVGRCPRCRRRPPCPPIRCRFSRRATSLRGFIFMRARPAPVGWGNAWTWAGRSMSYTRSPSDPSGNLPPAEQWTVEALHPRECYIAERCR